MPGVTQAAEQTTPPGIGGWLWIPAAALALSILNSAFEMPARISAFLARDSDGASVFFLYDVAFPAFLVWAAYSFVRRRARTRALMAIGLPLNVALLAAFALTGLRETPNWKEVASSCLALATAAGFVFSERAKRTFVL